MFVRPDWRFFILPTIAGALLALWSAVDVRMNATETCMVVAHTIALCVGDF